MHYSFENLEIFKKSKRVKWLTVQWDLLHIRGHAQLYCGHRERDPLSFAIS